MLIRNYTQNFSAPTSYAPAPATYRAAWGGPAYGRGTYEVATLSSEAHAFRAYGVQRVTSELTSGIGRLLWSHFSGSQQLQGSALNQLRNAIQWGGQSGFLGQIDPVLVRAAYNLLAPSQPQASKPQPASAPAPRQPAPAAQPPRSSQSKGKLRLGPGDVDQPQATRTSTTRADGATVTKWTGVNGNSVTITQAPKSTPKQAAPAVQPPSSKGRLRLGPGDVDQPKAPKAPKATPKKSTPAVQPPSSKGRLRLGPGDVDQPKATRTSSTRADGATVTKWTDEKGHSVTVTQSKTPMPTMDPEVAKFYQSKWAKARARG